MELLERTAQLDALDGFLRRAASGHGNMVLVGGEAGAGKTSLIRQFAEQAQGTGRVMIGACDALSSPRPLGSLYDVAPALGDPARRMLREVEHRPELFAAVLDDLASGEPTLFVIEDVHWADEATLDLLRFLGRRIDRTRALLTITYRDDEVPPQHPMRLVLGDLATMSHVHRVKVNLLSRGAVYTLAADSQVDGDELYRTTDGNPFYVTEVLSTGDAAVPATVRDAVLTRAARLSPQARDVLDAAAVIGARVEPWLLTRVVGDTANAVDECLGVGLLQVSGDSLQFRHQLALEAVLAAMSPVRRVESHTTVLAALRSRLPSSVDFTRLAHHADAADDREAVLAFAPLAARRAIELGAHREAAAQYARALRFGDGLPPQQRLGLLEAYAEVSDLAGQGDAGIGPREEMIVLARRIGDWAKEAEHLGWLAITLCLAGRDNEAHRAVGSALAALEGAPEGPTHARVYCHAAEVRMMTRDLANAIAWGERTVALAERIGDVQTLILGLHALGEARLVGGDVKRGRAALERSLRLAREVGDNGLVVGALADLGAGHGETFRFSEADRYLTEAIAYVPEHELFDTWRDWAVAWLALTRCYQGRWTEATHLAASVLRVPTAPAFSGNPLVQGAISTSFTMPPYIRLVALLALGRIRARRGDPQVWAALDEALSLAVPTDKLQRIASARAARAEAAWLSGKADLATAEARAVYDLAVHHQHPWHIGELGYWRWKTGDLSESPSGAAEPYALQMEGDWRGAAACWSALGCPYEAARALAESNDEGALREAFATFDRLGAKPAAAMVTQRLRDLGASMIPRGTRPGTRANPARLTTRELEVLVQIAEGCTNREIAGRLYISPKTVEHHVSGVLAKLEVSSRADAVRVAIELDLLSPN